MVLIGAAHALAGCTAAVTSSALADGPTALGIAQVAGWLSVLFVMTGGFMLIGLGLIFPTGRGHTVFWDRLVRLAAIVLPVIVVALFLLRPGPLQLFAAIENPIGVGPDLRSILGAQSSEIFAASTFLIAPLLGLSIASRLSDVGSRRTAAAQVVRPRAPGLGRRDRGGGCRRIAQVGRPRRRVWWCSGSPVRSSRSPSASPSSATACTTSIGSSVVRQLHRCHRRARRHLRGDDRRPERHPRLVRARASRWPWPERPCSCSRSFGPLRTRARVAVDRRFDRSQYDASRTIQALTVRLRDDVDLESD